MIIEDKRNKPEEVWLNKIKDGDIFEYKSVTYFKTAGTDYLCVDIENGDVCFFTFDTIVSPVNGKVVIE